MPASVEIVEKQALALPLNERARLVEKLLASLSGEVNADVERANLQEVRKRRDAVAAGKSSLVEGEKLLRPGR